MYEAESISSAVVNAEEVLKAEIESSQSKLATLNGHEFEQLVREILEACRLDVQANIRLKGPEIDLWLCLDRNAKPPRHVMIECKHYARSKRRVGIQQVLRAIGLQQVLKDSHVVENNVILSTTGFSGPAKKTARSHKVELLEFEELARWLTENALFRGNFVHPLLQPRAVDRNGRLNLPQHLADSALLNAGDVALVGVGDHFEIWDRKSWEEASRAIELPEPDLFDGTDKASKLR